jgi:hypothetical protein
MDHSSIFIERDRELIAEVRLGTLRAAWQEPMKEVFGV